MQVKIKQGSARGEIAAPPSKSMAHRLLIAAAMSEGESTVRGIAPSADVLATLDCIRALGAEAELCADTARVRGVNMRNTSPKEPLFCRESGSTLRFLIPVAWLSGNQTILRGAPSLMRRPMDIYENLAHEKGIGFVKCGDGITVCGPLTAGDYRVAGNVSSQFISGLLFALPLADGDSRILLTPPVESRSYIDLTVAALGAFGVTVAWESETVLSIKGGQSYTARDCEVEGDYSNAAFLDALGLLGGEVTVTGLADDSLQGDRVYRAYFDALRSGSPTLSIGDCPDLGPILFAMAAALNGATFTGTRRLRIKESDRVEAMTAELAKFGVSFEIGEDYVTIHPTKIQVPKQPLLGHNDHRIVMSCAVLATLTGGVIEGAEAVTKSFPDFFDRIRKLGLEVEEL